MPKPFSLPTHLTMPAAARGGHDIAAEFIDQALKPAVTVRVSTSTALDDTAASRSLTRRGSSAKENRVPRDKSTSAGRMAFKALEIAYRVNALSGKFKQPPAPSSYPADMAKSAGIHVPPVPSTDR